MTGKERRKIAALRTCARMIQGARKPIPAGLASQYHAALTSLQYWEAAAEAEDESLGFGPLALVLWGGGVMTLAAIGYTIGTVLPEVLPMFGKNVTDTVETFGQVSRWTMWALAGIGVYNLATKGKLL